MQFDPNNKVVKLCSQGMELEGQGLKMEALKLFQQAWDEATTNFEKFTAAHYVARHQKSVSDKLKWDETALRYALDSDGMEVKGILPSLYLNIGKCYEDLKDFANAKQHYQAALSFKDFLPKDGYGEMIKAGIDSGLNRIQINTKVRSPRQKLS